MNWHLSFSISSLVRCAPTAGLSWSSRKSTSTLRPITPPLAFSSASASWAPRCMSAARAANGPVSGQRAADPERILGLRAQDGREGQGRGAGRGGCQE